MTRIPNKSELPNVLLLTQSIPPNNAPTARTIMLLRRVAAKHDHGQAENGTLVTLSSHRTVGDCVQHPPFPWYISTDQEQTKPTTTDLIKTQAPLRSMMEDYWLVRPLLNLCLQFLSLQRKDTVNLCHKDPLPQELFNDIHCHYSSPSNHVHASPLVFVE